MGLTMLVGNREFSCKLCGNTVCGPCSATKRYLSKTADEKLRVCDLCDTKLDNTHLRYTAERILELRQKQAHMLVKVI